MASQKTINVILAQCMAIFPAQTNDTPETLNVLKGIWVEDLADVPDEALYAAMIAYRRAGEKWRPNPGELRKRALEITSGDAKSKALDAWMYLLDYKYELQRGDKKIDDRVLAQAVRQIGGFDVLNNMTVDDKPFIQKRFIELYENNHERVTALQLSEVRKFQLEAVK